MEDALGATLSANSSGLEEEAVSRGLPGHLCKYLLRTTILALKDGRPWDGAPWRLSVDHTAD